MRFTQRNPKFKGPDDLNERDREHYEVARALAGWFDKARFVDRYRALYPRQNLGSIIPSDYCFNRDNKGNQRYPRFLEWDHGRRYRFVGLRPGASTDSLSDRSQPSTPPVPTVSAPLPARVPVRRGTTAFAARDVPRLRTPDRHRCRRVCRPRVQQRRHRASAGAQSLLGPGCRLQTWTSAGAARRAERGLQHALHQYGPRHDRRQDRARVRHVATVVERLVPPGGRPRGRGRSIPDRLLPEAGHAAQARSLAAKALHFGAPATFIPVDTFAADLLHHQLGTPSWSTTSSLDHRGMAAWYSGYLTVIHRLGAVNTDLLRHLLSIDELTARGPDHARVRGLPKLVDKVFWWVGREQNRGSAPQLFVA